MRTVRLIFSLSSSAHRGKNNNMTLVMSGGTYYFRKVENIRLARSLSTLHYTLGTHHDDFIIIFIIESV